MTKKHFLAGTIVRRLLKDFYTEFPHIISKKDYRYALATQYYNELGHLKFIPRIINLIFSILPVEPDLNRLLTHLKKEINHLKGTNLNKRVLNVLNNVEKVIANSEFTKNLAIENGVNQDKIIVINPGVDPVEELNKKSLDKVESFLKVKTPRLITVSRFDKRKNHEKVIMALRNLKQIYPDIVYICVGYGDEEENIIRPVVKDFFNRGLNISGPFSPDAFFGKKHYLRYDAVLSMYHDQGLIPFKMLSFGEGTNFTAGLDKIRTSPDHGTAFDIAGKGIAEINSFKQSFFLARKIFLMRNKGIKSSF